MPDKFLSTVRVILLILGVVLVVRLWPIIKFIAIGALP